MTIGANAGNLCEPISGRSWDRFEVQRQIALRVNSYQAHGLTRGDRVFFHIGNCLEFFAELIAVWRLGGCAVPVELTLTPFEIAKLAKRLLPRFAIFDDSTDAELVSAPPPT